MSGSLGRRPGVRKAVDRIMLAHSRYTSANGDALSGGITYAALVGTIPALALLTAVGGSVGNDVRSALLELLTSGSPEPQAHMLAAIPAHPAVTALALFVLPYSSLRLVRAMRTGVRAMSGQNAGSGNPVADLLTDARLGLVGGLGGGLMLWLLAAVPAGPLRVAAAIGFAWTALALLLRFGVRPGSARPAWAAIGRAAGGGTAALFLLATVAGGYLHLTEKVHDELFGAAGVLVGALVLVSVSARIILRSASFAGTSAANGARGTAMPEESLHVIVPAHNEAAGIGETLAALARQTDRKFTTIVVDSASSDGTADVARAAARAVELEITIVRVTQLGAGTAFDAGARRAIAAGATVLLRTDADCLPRRDWVAAARRATSPFVAGGSGLDMACGRSTPRRDEEPTLAERYVLPGVTRALGLYGRFRTAHRDARYLAPYVLCHGHNIAVRAATYQAAGGAALHRLEEGSEDVVLLNRVRMVTSKVGRVEDMVVENSLRRLRAYGPRNTILWYWDRRYVPEADAVHVR